MGEPAGCSRGKADRKGQGRAQAAAAVMQAMATARL